MPVVEVISDMIDWDSIIRYSDHLLGPHSAIVVMKNSRIQHPTKYFQNIVDSSLWSFPERRGAQISIRSWRIREYPEMGYHVHEFQDLFLLHRDDFDPKDLESFYNHLTKDTSFEEKVLIGILASVGVGIIGKFLSGLKKR